MMVKMMRMVKMMMMVIHGHDAVGDVDGGGDAATANTVTGGSDDEGLKMGSISTSQTVIS